MEARRLAWDFELLASLPEVLPQQSPLGNKARALANTVMNTFNGTLESVRDCRKLAEEVMGKGWQAEANKQADQEEGSLWALGYCHIDTAWWVVLFSQEIGLIRQAVAMERNTTEGRANLVKSNRNIGPVSRVPVLRLGSTALQMARGILPSSV